MQHRLTKSTLCLSEAFEKPESRQSRCQKLGEGTAPRGSKNFSKYFSRLWIITAYLVVQHLNYRR